MPKEKTAIKPDSVLEDFCNLVLQGKPAQCVLPFMRISAVIDRIPEETFRHHIVGICPTCGNKYTNDDLVLVAMGGMCANLMCYGDTLSLTHV